jgi:excisionase family DNA binding protein
MSHRSHVTETELPPPPSSPSASVAGPAPSAEDPWVSARSLGSVIDLKPAAIRQMVHRRELPAYKIGSRLRFRLSDVLRIARPTGAARACDIVDRELHPTAKAA